MDFLSLINSFSLYIVVGIVLLCVCTLCGVFLVKSYRAGIAIGMDKKVLKRTMMSSTTFTILPSISILLGVITLSGALGIPLAWLRLSVIGSLQYELNVAEIAANALGFVGLKASEMDMVSFVTIALVMTVGILGGIVLSICTAKKYLGKVASKPKEEKKDKDKKPGYGVYASIAMFIGLCSAYLASYIGVGIHFNNYLPITVAIISGLIMLVFEYLIDKKKIVWLENFSIAGSMLIAMAAAIVINGIL